MFDIIRRRLLKIDGAFGAIPNDQNPTTNHSQRPTPKFQ